MPLKQNIKRGYFNRYHKNMPFFERLLKDINYALLYLKNCFSGNPKGDTIFVHPHYPSRGSSLYKIAKQLKLNLSNKIKKRTPAVVYWEYATLRQEFHLLEKLSRNIKVVNLHSRNIGKNFIDKAHRQVFGYSTSVNPLTFKGKIVKKNDTNAMHDGKILDAPLQKKEAGYIYQILINNKTDDNTVKDIRVPVVGSITDFVYIKYRDISERFKNTTIKTELVEIKDVLSEEEITLLDRFVKRINLDFGEMDVLRDTKSSKIYVVDVNNTPQSPPANIPPAEGKRAIQKLAQAFKAAFLTR